MARLLPWQYPKSTLPSRWTLRRWRRRALDLAKAVGARKACGICKRPMRAWGRLFLVHPRSEGKSRRRYVCTSCAELLITMLDVLEWYGACDHLPPEVWRPEPTPEETADMLAWDHDDE